MKNRIQRDSDFIRRVDELTVCPGAGMLRRSLRAAVIQALHSEAPSFYITREYAYKRLGMKRRGKAGIAASDYRAAMWEELEEALHQRLSEAPGEDEWEALDHVLHRHRPSRFFMSEEQALRLVKRHRRPSRRSRNSIKNTSTKQTPGDNRIC